MTRWFLPLALLVLACAPVNVAATHATAPDDPELRELVRLVNGARARAGLRPLAWNARLAEVAEAHSEDMLKRHYFSHVDPNRRDPFARMRAAGLEFQAAAENIAAGQTSAQAVFESWMDSPHHRENIMGRAYTEQGIGRFANHWTHCFMTPRPIITPRRFR